MKTQDYPYIVGYIKSTGEPCELKRIPDYMYANIAGWYSKYPNRGDDWHYTSYRHIFRNPDYVITHKYYVDKVVTFKDGRAYTKSMVDSQGLLV